MTRGAPGDRAKLLSRYARAGEESGGRRRLRSEYRDWLPEVTVSRCPGTGELVRWPLDTVDLDGLFWDFDVPVRRLPQAVPDQWLAMAGAVGLDRSAVADAPFRCRPGPAVPYVVPRLLNGPGVQVVIAQLPVGPHTAWVMTYFGPAPAETHRENLWGQDHYPVWRDGAWEGWAFVPFESRDNDYDLAPWLNEGKLLWVAPGDETWTLRSDHQCPFLRTEGERENPVIQRGRVHYLNPFHEGGHRSS
ncbi:hypothetical protein [Streptomyces sp. NPDC006012]|uniref:hypothetical protein n=1 Tax=Streptomyces sp. NPDC006012 TaxID=3364739 RepID=UPI00367C2D79